MRIDLKQAAEFLLANDRYLILMHASPDGDTLGCGYALCGALQRLGKSAKAVCPDEIPRRFDYMKEAITEQDFDHEVIVAVDVADSKLLADMKELGDKAALCIDHHKSNTEYAQRLLLREKYAAAAELVYELIKEMGVTIDKPVADCLYTGIATDCGCFKFSNTTPQTHIYAAELMALGADYARINYVMFDLKTQGRIQLEQEVLNNIRYYANGRIALVSVTLDTLSKIDGIDSDDIGAMAAIPRQIEGVDIGICIKEKKKGLFKASLRSSEKIDVSLIANKFGGGGHARAAGCSFTCTLDEAQAQLVEACCEALKQAGIV